MTWMPCRIADGVINKLLKATGYDIRHDILVWKDIILSLQFWYRRVTMVQNMLHATLTRFKLKVCVECIRKTNFKIVIDLYILEFNASELGRQKT